MNWTVTAVKYADRNSRTRADSFIMDDHPAAAHGMDYFVWVLENGTRQIVVDTGYDAGEATNRARPILRDPAHALQAIGVQAEQIDTVIITHLHYDHAGGLDRFPRATFHLQAAEMAFATGPCMCNGTLRAPFTVEHVVQMVRHIYSGRVVFHDGSAEVAPGVRVHCLGGHSRGLQVVEVATDTGPLILASDASHYYENFMAGKPFPIVADVTEMMEGFSTLMRLGGTPERVVPGHDPLVTSLFPQADQVPFAWRLDRGPTGKLDKGTTT